MTLIREIRLPNGRLTKNLGFGCAGILRLPMRRQRENLLRTVIDAGLTHFDVARMYGAGAAEGILGSSLQKQRDQITLATKFGFPCGVPSSRMIARQGLARWAANLHPGLKKLLKRKTAPSGDRHYDYSVREMEASLAISLTQLRTDRVDLFFVHEPRATDEIPEALSQGLRRQKIQGKIGAFGLSALPDDLAYFLQKRPELCGEATQYPFSWVDPKMLSPMPGAYTGVFHVLAGLLSTLNGYLDREKEFSRIWSDRLALDLGCRENRAIALLGMSLAARPDGMTLFFTSKAARVRRMIDILTNHSFPSGSLVGFRRELSQCLSNFYAM